jgi:23S rRNA (uridine2552-2'-O)-methyltransferase
MAPNLTGIAATDAARIEDIVDLALDFACAHLKPSGCLLVKCFNGSGYSQIMEKFRQTFKTVSSKKPKASRDKSSEIFLVGRGLKNPG